VHPGSLPAACIGKLMSKVLSRPELLKLTNERIRARPGFVEGMQIVDAETTGSILWRALPISSVMSRTSSRLVDHALGKMK
jgi:hypothetical protein